MAELRALAGQLLALLRELIDEMRELRRALAEHRTTTGGR
jgi:hypothetical protein